MRWQGRRQSSNIEDRRNDGGTGGFGGAGPRIGMSMPGGRRGGGLSIGAVIVVVVVSWFLGINPLTLLSGLQGGDTGGSPVSTEQAGQTATPGDEGGQFVATVLADTEDTWTRIFADGGSRYQVPTLVLFSGQTASACGYASAAAGPFYCPGDRKVYIDLAFYKELRDRFHAPGDFAQAYVIAHEVGHHVQNLLGVSGQVDELRGRLDREEQNALSVRVELQADCFAGVWGHHANRERHLLEPGDIDEGLAAAAAIGDDRMQREAGRRANPESWTHGSSDMRQRWFKRGFESGRVDACDTYQAERL